MESTYGDRVHAPDRSDTEDQLAQVVNDTVAKKGKVIIPAFAVGRTQEIVYSLHKLHVAGRIPDLPVFVDSPLAVNVTDVFKRHPECYDEETRKFVEDNGPVFTFSHAALHRGPRRVDRAQQRQGAVHHRLGVGHVRVGAHPAPPQEQRVRRRATPSSSSASWRSTRSAGASSSGARASRSSASSATCTRASS